MNGRNVFGLAFSVIVLLLVTGSGLAGVPPQPTEPVETSGTGASPGANAPWFVEEIDTDGDTGLYTSVAYDPSNGRTYVSYYDAQNKNLRVVYDIGSGGNCGPDDSWYCQTVDSEGDVGQYSSIAVRLGGVNVSYYDASNGDLKWAESSDYPLNNIWRVRTVDRGSPTSSVGLYTSLELPQYGMPYISYHVDNTESGDELRIARYVGGNGNCGWGLDANQWQCITIRNGEGVGQYTSLVLDSNLYRHIAYYDEVNGELWMATNESGSNCGPGGNTWSCYPISGASSDVGQYASQYVDSAGDFHIAYYDATAEKLMYARELASGTGNCGVLGSAQCDEIDAMPGIYHSHGISIAEDPAGYPAIAYQSANGSLKLARPLAALGMSAGSGNCGPEVPLSTWYCETIDLHGTWVNYRNGDYVSLDFSPSGLAHIAYYRLYTDWSDGNLMVAYQRFPDYYLPYIVKNP